MEMLALMHEADPYGHLLINGRPPTDTQLAIQAGAPEAQIPALLVELESAGVFSKTRTGVVYSRRMTRDEKKRAVAVENGKLGGNPNLTLTASKTGDDDEKLDNLTHCKDTVPGSSDNHHVNGRDKTQIPDARLQKKKDHRSTVSEFDQWYSKYPRKESKGQARKAFAAARRIVSLETLLAGRDRYAQACSGRDPKYIRLPATWLNGEGWADEPTSRTKQPSLGPL
jgi:hypothetical protein